ncbi:MAG: lipid-binding SYLF domain-containing protein [Chromatiales bacterium]|nr:lipid-binding SYLF domain-containing protein [Chromatiales bacterium]
MARAESRIRGRAAGLLAVCALVWSIPGAGWAEEAERLREAVDVLEQIMAVPENEIPPALLRDAAGIAIVPGVIKVGFVIGGRHGKGVVSVRGSDGQWSAPAFLSLTSGSVGWQIGAQSTDVVLVFKSRRGIDGIVDGKFTLGADAAVAAGPVGRNASAATDTSLKAEVYSYSRSRGLFAGVSLEGSALEIDAAANSAYYGAGTGAGAILAGELPQLPAEADALRTALARAVDAAP